MFKVAILMVNEDKNDENGDRVINQIPLLTIVIASAMLSLVFLGEISLTQKEYNQFSK